ncbi:MAG TPA: hypothetical protein VG759_22065, partial [Candidatus Angelobacter sp.]|nr:hypothetical protein [Candidatus Angelobacter sp.]
MDCLENRLAVSTRFIVSTVSLIVLSLSLSISARGLGAALHETAARTLATAASGSVANQVVPGQASAEAIGATWLAIRSPYAGDANHNSYTVYEFSTSSNGPWSQVCGNGTPGDSYWRRCAFVGLTPASSYFVRVTFV